MKKTTALMNKMKSSLHKKNDEKTTKMIKVMKIKSEIF